MLKTGELDPKVTIVQAKNEKNIRKTVTEIDAFSQIKVFDANFGNKQLVSDPSKIILPEPIKPIRPDSINISDPLPVLNLESTKELEDSINILKNKKKFIEDVQNQLDDISKYGPLRTYKATPPTIQRPPPMKINENLSVKIIEPETLPISLSPVIPRNSPYVEIVNPQNDYEYLFQVLSTPELSKTPRKYPIELNPSPIRRIPKMKPTIKIPKKDMIGFIMKNIDRLMLSSSTVQVLNQYFNTNDFTVFKILKYRDDKNNEQEINTNIMLQKEVEPENFIKYCVMDILDKKPEYEENRTLVYEDIFIDLFGYPIKIEKSEIDNQMIELLMDQQRRGLVVDLDYVRKYVNYDILSIFNKLNYQYLFNEFTKIQTLLFSQINIIKKNHMIFV